MAQPSLNSTSGKSLNRSEERFRLLVEGVTDYAIFMLDPQGQVLTWNTGAVRIKAAFLEILSARGPAASFA